MKKTRFRSLACLMAMLMLLTTVGHAADQSHNIHLVDDDQNVIIYVDNVRVKSINAYTDGFGEIRVESTEDLKKIFPDHTFPTMSGILVHEWVTQLGYTYEQEENELYIYTSKLPVLEDAPDPTTPLNPSTTEAEVFVNNLRVNNAGVHVYGGEFFISSFDSLYTIFPNEAVDSYESSATQVSSLRTWAQTFKYTFVSSGNKVYLNNNGREALELSINGELVKFPDQQPIKVPPGRTMVPVRMIAEMLGCNVAYDTKNDRVIIEGKNLRMILWPGHTTYWVNGIFYKMDVEPFITNGRTMVPIRFIGEAFGYTVKWDGSGVIPVVRLTK